jgi:hypothetical protein
MPSATIIACLSGYDERSVPKSELTGANHWARTLADVVALCSKAVRSEKPAAEEFKPKDSALPHAAA